MTPGVICGGNGETFPLSTRPRLTGEQQRQRSEGLRVLARLIARHYLAHPELYPAPAGTIDGVDNDDAMVDAVARADGDLSHKEAAE
jgi:hypothetical protein